MRTSTQSSALAERHYRHLVHAVLDAIVTFDAAGIIVGWNLGAERIFGYAEAEIAGRPLATIIPQGSSLLAVTPATGAAACIGADGRLEIEGLHKTGRSFPLEVSVGRWDTPEGTFITGIIRDISMRKEAEHALRESESRYRSLLKGSPDDITVTNLEGRILMVSPAAVTMFRGKTEADWLGRQVLDFLVPEDRERALSAIARLMQGNTSVPSEYRGLRADGSTLDIEVHSQLLRDAEERPHGLMIIVRDISTRKRAEERIASLLKEKELLLKEVHHRIKNNMNTVKAILSLQRSGIRDPAAIAALKDSEARVQSMMQLYDKLYRSETFTDLRMDDYLSTLVDEIVSNFPNRQGVTLEKHLDPIVLDVRRMSSVGIVVNELITNIMKYAFTGRDSGLIAVSASQVGKRITVVVRDDGIGMPEPVDITSASSFGLRLVGLMIEQLEGTIRAEQRGGTAWFLEFSG